MELNKDFIETVDRSDFVLYADTDSSYSLIPLPFDKFEDQHQTVDYVQKIAELFNEEYIKIFNETIVKYGNVNPKYNFMDFKSEVVAYRGFFNTKKYYALAKMWDEGTFFDHPKIKKTGGQIVKADSTPIIFNLLTDIYLVLLLDFSITDEVQLYRKIFTDIKIQYLKKVEEAVKNYKIYEFGIPKKWGLKKLKRIPKQVEGAMLYNYLFDDILRPGESVLQVQIRINPSKLLQYMDEHQPTGEFQIKNETVNNKLNVISFPVDITENQIKNIHTVFSNLDIQFDLRTILEFNVNKKLDQFQKLFRDETIRMAI
jgi:hypothetical protein